MPTDLTGPPTSLGIGTYNVDDDAPSGLGFNEAMAQIDALLQSTIQKPAGIATGEAVVWNGTGWSRSTVQKLGPTSLSGLGLYRKVTPKSVINTTAETDLLNGEITLGANVLGATGGLRLQLFGSSENNTGSAIALPRWKLKLGTTTLLDSNIVAGSWSSAASVFGWRASAIILNSGATDSQVASLELDFSASIVAGAASPTVGSGHYGADSTTDLARLIVNNNGIAVDTTVAQALAFTVTLPTANANEFVSLYGATAEII